MKKILLIVAVVTFCLLSFLVFCPKNGGFTLFENGKTDYRIVVSGQASESEIWAGRFLAETLNKIGGADFVIVDDQAEPGGKEIVIGRNTHTDKLLKSDVLKFVYEDEAFQIRSQGSSIFIYGGQKRGTMYGVIDFLENYLNCRWYSSKVSSIPKRNSFSFSAIDYADNPAVRFRAVDYFDIYKPEIGTPARINSQRFFRGNQPGGLERYWFEHSFELFVPPAEFFDSHPEYFALRDGKRQKDRSQLCLTNPEVLKILTDRLKDFIVKNPEYRVYNVAQNDNKNPCLCDNCQAIVKKEDGESGLMLWFVNQVAEEIEKEFPEEFLGTFAYQYTRKPPKTIRPRKNVMVVLCNIECDFSHSFSHSNNAKFVEDLKNWTQITPNVFIWDYVVNYRHYLLPHPNFNVLQENIQILNDHGVIGILEQANYQCPGGEFAELRAYVLAKLLWDPDCEVRPIVEDFIDGYYQKSGPYVLEYFDLVQDLPEPNTRLTYATRITNPIFTKEFLVEADRIFDAAEAAADNEEILHRVQTARLGVMYLDLAINTKAATEKGRLEKFKSLVRKNGMTLTSEGLKAEDAIKRLMKKYNEEK